jgi:hypothetical protein
MAWFGMVLISSVAIHLFGHLVGVTTLTLEAVLFVLFVIVSPIILGLPSLIIGVSRLWEAFALAPAAALIYFIGLGAGVIDDPSFCPTAPAGECLGYSVIAVLLYVPVVLLFWLGLVFGVGLRTLARGGRRSARP